MKTVLHLAILTVLLSGLAEAEVFKYTDSAGKTYFVSEESQIPEKHRANAIDSSGMRQVSKVPAKEFYKAPVNRSSAGQPKGSGTSSYRKVEIYVTTWCPYCKQLEEFLKKNRVPYVRYDVEQSAQGRKFYASVGQGGIPITKVGKSIIRGFKKQEILQAAS